MTTPDKSISITDDLTLLNCGTGKCGYMSSSFVDLHSLPCSNLHYQIPVYNVDGSLNKGGAITHVCTLDMKIGLHCEHITFRVTDTGSSNIILGLKWLQFHDPLVNWNEGKLFFYVLLVCDMGNPWVVFTLSIPIPVKTCTHAHGYGFSLVSSWVQVCIYDS